MVSKRFDIISVANIGEKAIARFRAGNTRLADSQAAAGAPRERPDFTIIRPGPLEGQGGSGRYDFGSRKNQIGKEAKCKKDLTRDGRRPRVRTAKSGQDCKYSR